MNKELEEIREKYKDDNGLMRRLDIIEKELKALEIIKENIKHDIFYNPSDNEFFLDTTIICESKQEYDLLKEVLEDE